tara:strand:+ start:2929 stop:3285 length:357 start_codon:yes stop_codon:yes gene_type:complete
MASTRSKNTPGNYELEQKVNTLSKNYDLYKHSQHGSPYKTAIPTLGYMPNFISRDALSTNPIDIESALLGINSTNLVEPKPNTIAHLKKLPEKEFFNRLPLIMPNNLVIEDNQRPLRS